MQAIKGQRPSKVPPIFFPAEVRYTICVVEFRRRTKSVKKQMQPIKGHRPPKVPPKKKSADLRTFHAP